MSITVKRMTEREISACTEIWNSVVRDGNAFPQEEELDENSAAEFFSAQSYTGAAVCEESGEIVGVYILHPNNVGRCGHICNASYAVKKDRRGEHIGEALVRDCMRVAAELGFRVLQFNAVVSTKARLRCTKSWALRSLGLSPGASGLTAEATRTLSRTILSLYEKENGACVKR